jgi:cytochrome c oxidase cbb3-type subunit III
MKTGDERLDDTNLLSHSYDGIQEYDNPTPGWWKAIFLGTVIFSVAYVVWYHGGPGKSVHEKYDLAMAEYEGKYAAAGPSVSPEALARLAADPQALASGEQVFQTHCASCHTPEGKGLVGPNLTDDYQIHGQSRMDIYQVIYDGVPAKGMIPWGPVLLPDQLAAVAAYVASLRHTNVDGGKPAEGEQVAPFAN